jgi:hypothetical protein
MAKQLLKDTKVPNSKPGNALLNGFKIIANHQYCP